MRGGALITVTKGQGKPWFIILHFWCRPYSVIMKRNGMNVISGKPEMFFFHNKGYRSSKVHKKNSGSRLKHIFISGSSPTFQMPVLFVASISYRLFLLYTVKPYLFLQLIWIDACFFRPALFRRYYGDASALFELNVILFCSLIPRSTHVTISDNSQPDVKTAG